MAKEVLEFGNPCVLNELRGKFGFDGSGEWMQEQYSSADLSGVANSPQFSQATATTKGVGITADGKLRVMFVNGGFFIFEKLGDGELGRWLQEASCRGLEVPLRLSIRHRWPRRTRTLRRATRSRGRRWRRQG